MMNDELGTRRDAFKASPATPELLLPKTTENRHNGQIKTKMPNRFTYILLLFSLLNISLLPGCKKNDVKAEDAKPAFKTVGYIMIARPNVVESAEQIDFSMITHLNLAFVNPDSAGNFTYNPILRQLVDMAHAANVKVLMSIGGGSIPAYFVNYLADDKRAAFVQAFVTAATAYNVDGIDVDLEGSSINQHYTAFVKALSLEMKQRNKLLTAALATVYGDAVPDEALQYFDFINIMSYDKTGPWNPSNAGQHSPYDMAVNDLAYWNNRSVAKDKLILGVPFYGYGFGANNVTSSMPYSAIINAFAGAENSDQLTMTDGETMYYNGIPTIKNKTTLAKQKGGGVMIWELLQDAQGQNSLLKNIHDVINQ